MIYLRIVFTKERDLWGSWDNNKEQETTVQKECPRISGSYIFYETFHMTLCFASEMLLVIYALVKVSFFFNNTN